MSSNLVYGVWCIATLISFHPPTKKLEPQCKVCEAIPQESPA